MLSQTHAEARRAKMAAILVGAEITVVQVFGEMNVAEGIAATDGELIVIPWEPAQGLSPFALAMIAVRVVSERKAAGDGKVMSVIIHVAMPAVRQQIEGCGVKGRRNWITREAAGE